MLSIGEAGEELIEECKTLGGCRITEAKITNGYNLAARYVIHTVSPHYGGTGDSFLLELTLRNVLDLAKEKGIHSIAIPAIGCAKECFPNEEGTRIAAKAVVNWKNENQEYDLEVVFTCADPYVYRCFCEALAMTMIRTEDIKIFTDNIETDALIQISALVSQPAFSECKIRIMPDVHAGAGCVIGFTADLGDKVIPNIVGVDIGCGMLTTNLGKIEIDFDKLDQVIRRYIPAGRNVRDKGIIFSNIQNLRCKDKLKDTDRLQCSLGTLGGGNHFIEVDEGKDGTKYLVIHTGSRNLGKQVAEIYQQTAIDDMSGKSNHKSEVDSLISRYKSEGRQKEISGAITELKAKWNSEKPDKKPDMPNELCYLTGENREMYLHDMRICQEFAKTNRQVIRDCICHYMGWKLSLEAESFDTIHNYIDLETNIVRKGAISAKLGERVLIPMNMRDGCIIAVGKGNEDWNCSAPHGAGRIMSRSKARQNVTMDEYKKSMEGIYTTSVDSSTIDESPMAYKPMDEIISCIGDTVDIVEIIKPVYNFKAGE